MLPAISQRLEWVADAAIAQLWRRRLGITCNSRGAGRGSRLARGLGALGTWSRLRALSWRSSRGVGNAFNPPAVGGGRPDMQEAVGQEAVGQEAVGKKRSRKRSHR